MDWKRGMDKVHEDPHYVITSAKFTEQVAGASEFTLSELPFRARY